MSAQHLFSTMSVCFAHCFFFFLSLFSFFSLLSGFCDGKALVIYSMVCRNKFYYLLWHYVGRSIVFLILYMDGWSRSGYVYPFERIIAICKEGEAVKEAISYMRNL